MPEKKPVGCARPTGGVVGEKISQDTGQTAPVEKKETRKMIQVGKKAPDFEAPCFYKGSFGAVKLSEYLGKWVVLCFYPGDFTFV